MSLYLTGAWVTIGAAGNFDHLFVKYADKIPPQYLRHTSERESGLDPYSAAESKKNPGTDVARGLMQITRIALKEYNRTRGTSYEWGDVARGTKTGDMWTPDINVKIGAGLMNDIARDYAQSGVAGLKPDWNDPRWVALFIYGFSAGHSAKSGVIYVAKILAEEKTPITVTNIGKRAATLPLAHETLAKPAKMSWAINGAANYFRASGTPMVPRPARPQPRPVIADGRKSIWNGLVTVGVVAVAAVAAIGFSKAG